MASRVLSALDPTVELLEMRLEHDNEGTVRLAVRGELDLFTRPALARELARAQSTGREVVLDLEGLEFMDCGGLAMLLGAQARSPLHVVAPTGGAALMLLHVTGAML
jgi:anti-anti-sigma factor